MDRMLYIAMTGAREIMNSQAVNTNNLANASTTGFRADLEAFTSTPVWGDGHPDRAYATVEGMGVDLSGGSIQTTGRDLDVAIKGDGWIAVQAPDGSEAYTRAGDLRVDSFGILTTGAGYPVIGEGGPIAVPPNGKLEIGQDGTITVQPLGQDINALAVVDRIKLVKPSPNALKKGEEGLMQLRGGGLAEADASVTLVSGALESSNVSTVDSMVRMIELARQFEMQVKMMKTAEDNDRSAAKLMSMS
ncbi:flagellar basal-body rod protein FlgF [Thiolapillus brandeum]|uniref:Flagellar basal-body rod protein FlgF n=1 Tax=Thiolapillus brandeum TaxID=1076588 RepID=A0A7U6JHB2_9GAMM|nr:flagellar basal-body rod protein FlgF [Thiolapillus brandeum]BAO44289.1 flagellar basal-body rod protein FlgF [Thiolapillus brandeum]